MDSTIHSFLTDQTIGGLIILLLFVLINGFCVWYFSYFKKSGEYHAVLENIEELTKKTESIKKDLEVVKANEVDLVKYKREALLKCYVLMWEVIHDTFFGAKLMKPNVPVAELTDLLSKITLKVTTIDATVRLYFDNPSMYKQVEVFMSDAISGRDALSDAHQKIIKFDYAMPEYHSVAQEIVDSNTLKCKKMQLQMNVIADIFRHLIHDLSIKHFVVVDKNEDNPLAR